MRMSIPSSVITALMGIGTIVLGLDAVFADEEKHTKARRCLVVATSALLLTNAIQSDS